MIHPLSDRVAALRPFASSATGRLAARLAGLGLAVAIVAFDLPSWLRLTVAAPILLWVAGDTILRLILGPGAMSDDRPAPSGDLAPTRGDPWIIPMVLLVGVLVALATALALATFGFGLHLRGILTGITGVGVLGSLAVWWTERRSRPGVDSGRRGGFWSMISPKQAAAVALSGLVLVGAVNVARSLYDVTPETHYALTRFVEKSMLTDALSAKPGAPVALHWQVQSFGWVPPEKDLGVEITVGDSTPSSPRTTQQNTTAAGADSARDITAQIRAPRKPNTYLVRIVTQMPNGEKVDLTTHLKVQR